MRNGDWIQTFTGRQFWPMDPRPEEVHGADIARALSKQCRFNGHCREFYSVAQHSYLVSCHVTQENALWGLLHDASEAYLGDIPSPIKKNLPGVAEIEERLLMAVAERFDLPWPMPDEVKRIDAAILADEKACLMAKEPADWRLSERRLGIDIVPMDVTKAAYTFLAALFDYETWERQ